MKKRLRSQVGRVARRVSSILPTDPSFFGTPVSSFPSSANGAKSAGSSLRLDRVINAYLDGSDLVLVVPDGRRIRTQRVKAEWASFISKDLVFDDLRRMMREHHLVVAMKPDGEWLRICWKDAAARRKYCAALHGIGIHTYDGNVDPFTRWMIDNSSMKVVPGRIGYLDLECDSRLPFSRMIKEARILSWALVCDAGEFVEVLEADTDHAERELLLKLWECLDCVDQVAAWNGDKFDFPLLTTRTLQRRIRAVFERWLFLDHMQLFKRMNVMAAESGDEKQSVALNAVCNAVLGEGKLDFDASTKTWEFWEAGGEKRDFLVDYNLRDSKLMAKLESKTGYIALLNSLASACGILPNSRGMLPTVQVESLLQHLANQRGMRFQTNIEVKRAKFGDSNAQYRGAYVMDPAERGIIKNVHVADFSSLYPTIIRTWNMSTDTKRPTRVSPSKVIDDCVRKGVKPWNFDDECVAPITGVVFKKEPIGLLSGAVAEMMRLRKEWSDKKAAATPGTEEWVDADRRSTAYKIAANSCYGAVGMGTFRHHDVDVAESVSQAGVWLIKQTIKAAEDRGLQVVYSDTDSVLVRGCTKDEFDEFVKWCNGELYPRILKLLGCEPGLINLAYEKAFERIVLIKKKRYVGRYSHYKGTAATKDSKPEVKGLEYKRGDSIRLARQMQAEAVDLLVGQENGGIEDPTTYRELLDRWRVRIMEGSLELRDVVISKSLNKALKDYAVKIKKDGTPANQLPHIEVAKKLKARGRDVSDGTRIDYVVTNGSTRPMTVIPAEDWTGDVDRAAIWESMVAPPTIRVLEAAFPGENWKSWTKAPSAEPTLF